MNEAKRIAAIGECMVELSQAGSGLLKLGFAGDTSNTAVYLSRLGAGQVDYVTALGDDPYSDAMVDFWHAEGVGTRQVRRLEGRLPGLYMIRTDERGERSFHYWRSVSAARELMGEDLADLAPPLLQSDLIYFSAITLQILEPAHRRALLALIELARSSGIRVAFDSNYRANGWHSKRTARMSISAAYRLTDIALPTFDDEKAVFGDTDPMACMARLNRYGIGEVALKCGAQGAWVGGRGIAPVRVPANSEITAVDTTGAGDSFNAAYLAARLDGAPAREAAAAGNRLAGIVVTHPGAIIPKDKMP
ncbi:MAG: sugar kinase [Alphaproteobacteria bacterium]